MGELCLLCCTARPHNYCQPPPTWKYKSRKCVIDTDFHFSAMLLLADVTIQDNNYWKQIK